MLELRGQCNLSTETQTNILIDCIESAKREINMSNPSCCYHYSSLLSVSMVLITLVLLNNTGKEFSFVCYLKRGLGLLTVSSPFSFLSYTIESGRTGLEFQLCCFLLLLLLLLSRFSRVRLCDPIDCSPPGSPVPGILQARTLEWVAISFSNA